MANSITLINKDETMKKLTYKQIAKNLFNAMAKYYGDTSSINGISGNFSVLVEGRSFIVFTKDHDGQSVINKETALNLINHLESGSPMPLFINAFFHQNKEYDDEGIRL